MTGAVVVPVEGKSGKQQVTWDVLGDCADPFDDTQTEFIMYEGEDCYFAVTVVPAKPRRSVVLQWLSSRGRWITESKSVTNSKGVAYLYPEPYDQDGYFLCEIYDYRIGLERLGSAKSLLSDIFTIDFVAYDDYC